MEKEKNQQKKEKESCPLCEVSEETIKRLKEKGKRKEELGNKNNKK